MGTILTWMSDKDSGVFVIATANRISTLPPELLRKGRFDELFFISLPEPSERKEILRIHSERLKIVLSEENIFDLVGATKDYTGVEIEEVLKASLFTAFADGKRGVIVEDVLQCVQETTILAKTQKKLLKSMEEWAVTHARRANTLPYIKQAQNKAQNALLVPEKKQIQTPRVKMNKIEETEDIVEDNDLINFL